MPNEDETEIQIEGGTLFADQSTRTVRGLLLPWNEASDPTRTNIGPVEFPRGVVKIPRDASVVTANIGHDREQPVGRATALEDTEKGLVATFSIAETDEGDQLLADISEGRLNRLSAEVKGILRDGVKATTGALFGAAFVTEGAFKSAALYAELAPITDKGREFLASQPTKTESEIPMSDEAIITPEPAQVVVPESLAASVTAPATTTPRPWGGKREVLAAMARRLDGTATKADESLYASILVPRAGAQALYASLDVQPFSSTGAIVPYNDAPQYIGELTETVYGITSFADLVGQGDLLSPEIKAFHWTTLPTLGSGANTWASSYPGNSAAVPTSAMATAPYTVAAKYFAGGVEVPIEFEMFGVDAAVLDRYYQRQAQNFGLWVDSGVFTTINAALTAVEADDPTGLDIGPEWSQIIDAINNVQDQKGGNPTAVVIEKSIYKAAMKVATVQGFAYLNASGGLEDGTLESILLRKDLSGQLSTGQVLAGNFKDGATLYTLPGSPLRFQARNISAGAAVDTAVVGAAAVVLQQSECFSLVEPYSA